MSHDVHDTGSSTIAIEVNSNTHFDEENKNDTTNAADLKAQAQ